VNSKASCIADFASTVHNPRDEYLVLSSLVEIVAVVSAVTHYANADNSLVAVELPKDKIIRYRNTISSTSSHRTSTPMAPIDSRHAISYYYSIVSLGFVAASLRTLNSF